MGRPGEFLRRLGVPKAKTLGPAALSEIALRCGQAYLQDFKAAVDHAEALMDQGERTDVALQELYSLMYRDLDTAIATHMLSSDVTVAWLRLTDSQMPEQGRLLDLGCGIGVISCWHAQHSPDLEVVGIDRDPNAVEVAAALAERLGINNVRFEVGDYEDRGQSWGTFDHAICVTVAYADLDDFATLAERFPTARAMAQSSSAVHGDAAAALGRSVVQGGKVWSLERLPDLLVTLQWWYQLQNAGFRVDSAASSIPVGARERMPLTIATKASDTTDSTELAESSFRIFGFRPEIDRPWADGPT